MRLKGTAALALIAALVATMLGGGLAQGAPPAQAGAPIRLRAITFNPTAGESGAAPFALTRRTAPAGRGYYIVQAQGPVTEEWKASVTGLGVELLHYIPDYAFKVRMSREQAAQLRSMGITSFVGLFHPYYALSPELAASGQQLVNVHVEQGGDGQAVANAAITAGATLVGVEGNRLIVGGERAQLNRLAGALDVAWIEPLVLYEKHNSSAGGIVGATSGAGGGARARGYDGSSQIAAVADTGIGNGTAATAHRDIPSSRVVAVYNWPGVTDSCFQTIVDDGAVDVDSGHGTHVAGSVLASGDPAGFGTGIAPAARLVFQATENYVLTSNFCKSFYGLQNDYYLTGLNNLYGLYDQAYTAGARVHANSWGSAQAGAYTANSATTDQFIWDRKDMTITFSAGNSGVDANADGVVDNDSIGAPATAKNVITVGASENDGRADGGLFPCDTSLTYVSRDTSYQNGQTCSSMGGTNILGTPRQRWGFTANPIADDPSGGNAQQMAAFSSRGPTDDGRIKPDVVAPGTWILSSYSDAYQEGYDSATNPRNNSFQSDGWGMPRNSYYKYFGGTSMSNPIAAGGAVVVRDYYQKAHGINASAALVKATLINTAVDLLDENNDGVNDNDFPIPNVHEGWGLINLDNATDGSERFFDVSTGLATGATRNYDVTLSGGPLKITVVWSDYPAAAAAAVTLVNNLDLTVTSPTGTVYRGNVFSGGWSASGGSADTRNNVENVYIQSPAVGTWRIEVRGANVPQGSQPFALVVGGASSVAEVTPPPPTLPSDPSNLRSTSIQRRSIAIAWNDNSSNESGFRIERCTGSTCTNFSQIATVGADVTSYTNSGLTRNTTYRYRVLAYNSAGNSGYSNILTVTTRN
jgi:subtilisin family serine protease